MARDVVCADCGTVDTPTTETRGSIFIEIILWLCFLVPGLIYSIWRLTTRHKVCRKCHGKHLLPLDTPGGKAALAKFKA